MSPPEQPGRPGGGCGEGPTLSPVPSPPQCPMALWSRSLWRTARWCGRRAGSSCDSEWGDRTLNVPCPLLLRACLSRKGVLTYRKLPESCESPLLGVPGSLELSGTGCWCRQRLGLRGRWGGVLAQSVSQAAVLLSVMLISATPVPRTHLMVVGPWLSAPGVLPRVLLVSRVPLPVSHLLGPDPDPVSE